MQTDTNTSFRQSVMNREQIIVQSIEGPPLPWSLRGLVPCHSYRAATTASFMQEEVQEFAVYNTDTGYSPARNKLEGTMSDGGVRDITALKGDGILIL